MINSMKQQVYDLVEEFDYEKFFQYSGLDNHGAVGLITPCQALTISNLFNGMASHEATLQIMATVIYNYSNPLIDARLLEKIERVLSLSIRMRLISEQGQKMIQIFFPDNLTREQLNLLSAYQNTYGEKVRKVSIQYEAEAKDNLPIGVFKDHEGNDNNSHSFEEAVKHAQTLPVVERIDVPDECIIGSVLSSDGSTLCEWVQSLGEYVARALEKGLDEENCELVRNHVISMRKLIEKRGNR